MAEWCFHEHDCGLQNQRKSYADDGLDRFSVSDAGERLARFVKV